MRAKVRDRLIDVLMILGSGTIFGPLSFIIPCMSLASNYFDHRLGELDESRMWIWLYFSVVYFIVGALSMVAAFLIDQDKEVNDV